MAKKESTILNMVLTLLVITLISGLSLGFLNNATLSAIGESKQAKKVEAIKMVVPEFDNNPVEEAKTVKTSAGEVFDCYPASKNGEIVGYAISASSNKGFGGLVRIMVGFKPDGTIVNTSVLEHKETPGLGTKMAESPFKPQFEGKNPESFKLQVKKDGGDVDAITAATISSRAFCEALSLAYDAFKNDLK